MLKLGNKVYLAAVSQNGSSLCYVKEQSGLALRWVKDSVLKERIKGALKC